MIIITQDYKSDGGNKMRRAFRSQNYSETFPVYGHHVTVFTTYSEFYRKNPCAPDDFDSDDNLEWEVTEYDESWME